MRTRAAVSDANLPESQMPDPSPTPASQSTGRSGFWTFWTTLPGILTGVAALLTAIVGLMTALNRQGRERNASTSDKPVPAQSAPASQPTASSTPVPSEVLVRGRLTMRSPDGADLEKGLVGTSVPGGGDLYLYCSGVDCLLNPMSSLMVRTDGVADKAACVAALGSGRDGALHLQDARTGQILCIQTAEGHVGSLEFVTLPGVGSAELVLSYTLYR